MNKETVESLPYVAIQELIDLRNFIKSSFEEHADVIEEDHVDSVLYQYRDTTKQFAFNIQFHKFDTIKKQNEYKVYFSPSSLKRIAGTEQILKITEVKDCFKTWIDLVRKMHEVREEYYDPYKKFYDQEFTHFFTNADEDAAVNPFELEKQEILYYFLVYAQKKIENSEISDDQKDELLADVAELKQNIPILTKKRLVIALSKFAQKAKKISNKVFHEIFDVLKKEVIKKGLNAAADQIPNLLDAVQSWTDILP